MYVNGLIILSLAIYIIDAKDVPRFVDSGRNVTAVIGRDATLTCSVKNLQNYKVAWLRVDTQTILTIGPHVITKNHRVGVSRGDQEWTLTLRDIRLSDGGRYMCQINTEPMITQTHNLHVSVPPDIVNSSSSGEVIIREGENVSLHCAASGTPQPTITWRREDSALMKIGKQTVGKWSGVWLNLTAVSRNMNGAFLCIATNGVPPSVSKRILLRVLCRPSLWVSQKTVGVYVGDTISLQCRIEALPLPVLYWMHSEEKKLQNDSKHTINVKFQNYKHSITMKINNVSREDTGSYQCRAENSLGAAQDDVTLYTLATTTMTSTIFTSSTAEILPTASTSIQPYAELEVSVNNRQQFPHDDNFVVVLSQHQMQNLEFSPSS